MWAGAPDPQADDVAGAVGQLIGPLRLAQPA